MAGLGDDSWNDSLHCMGYGSTEQPVCDRRMVLIGSNGCNSSGFLDFPRSGGASLPKAVEHVIHKIWSQDQAGMSKLQRNALQTPKWLPVPLNVNQALFRIRNKIHFFVDSSFFGK